jgi:hypothetical protein
MSKKPHVDGQVIRMRTTGTGDPALVLHNVGKKLGTSAANPTAQLDFFPDSGPDIAPWSTSEVTVLQDNKKLKVVFRVQALVAIAAADDTAARGAPFDGLTGPGTIAITVNNPANTDPVSVPIIVPVDFITGDPCDPAV